MIAIRDPTVGGKALPAIFGLIVGSSAFAAPVIDQVSSTTLRSYSADVSATDLLHGITPTITGWNTGNNASPTELNDGVHGDAFGVVSGDNVQGAWTTVGATAEYDLGIGPSGGGWDITTIRSIADWENVGFGNQAWTLEAKPEGGNYTTLVTVDHQPISGGGTTKVTITDSTGVLAGGIRYIKITANQVNGGANAGAFVWRELDVEGIPTNDEAPPSLDTLSSVQPADDSVGIALTTDLIATFSEAVTLSGSGSLLLKNLSGGSDIAISLPGDVSVSGAVLTITPPSNLAASQEYAVVISSDAITDLAGNPYAGLLDSDTPNWSFTSGEPDLTSPTLDTLSSVVPADDATGVALAANLEATFNEPIALTGSGSITLQNLSGGSDININLPGDVSISGSTLTINPPSDLNPLHEYAVAISNDAIVDLAASPNSYVGLTASDSPNWTFTAADQPLRIMCMGDSITVGYTDNPGWTNHPFEFGYRSGLYSALNNAGYNFLFVGGSTEPWTGISGDPTNGGTYTPPLDLREFGQDGHRGYGGKAASYLNSNILTWLASDDPDIILLKIGTNSQDQSGLDTLVNTITTTKPDCHLIIAQIMPKFGYQQGIVDYNTYIRETLVPNYQAMGRKVSLVDQYAPFLTNAADLTSIDQSLFSNGINHPDNDGYDKMALVWFEGIESLGLGPTGFQSYISNPTFGLDPAQQGPDLDPDGDALSNAIEAWFGTHPGEFDQGISNLSTDGTTSTFTHPQNENPPPDYDLFYQWSTNLSDWYVANGSDGPEGGPSLNITTNTVGAETTVTAQSSEALGRVFLRAAVQPK